MSTATTGYPRQVMGQKVIAGLALLAATVAGITIVVIDEDIQRADRFTELTPTSLSSTSASVADPVSSVGSTPDRVPVSTPDQVPVSTPDQTPPSVVFSEIMYHPADDSDSREFVEITNIGGDAVDVSRWCVRGFRTCIGDAEMLESGAALVVEDTGGRLANTGELLQLLDGSGRLVDEVEYGTIEPWPPDADGLGLSLQRRDLGSPADLPGNWEARAPSPGVTLETRAPLPTWSEVTVARRPAPDEPVRVRGRVSGVDAARATIHWRVGFGDERSMATVVDIDGGVDVELPGADAGQLFRVRLEAESDAGDVGTWPRSTITTRYGGTTIRDAADDVDARTDLPRFQWFMEPDLYAAAADDTTLFGDTGYEAVLAVNGEIFDGTLVRIKGQSARFFDKPKWKFSLPRGTKLHLPAEMTGSAALTVDEFALHSGWNDKSMIREILSLEAFASVGLPVTLSFPVQVELNGDFFGLFTYVEQPDSDWRARVGLDDGAVWEVGAFERAVLAAEEADLPDDEFRRRLQRENGSDEDDDELRRFITELHSFGDDLDARRAWMIERVDLPAVIDTLAVSLLIEHTDYQDKNYRIALLPDGRFSVIPADLEYTWGREWNTECQWACEDVAVRNVSVASRATLFAPFIDDPVLAEMLRVRTASLADDIVDPAAVGARLGALSELISDEAARDRETWGTYGTPQSVDAAIDEILTSFVTPLDATLNDPANRFDPESVVPAGVGDVSVEIIDGSTSIADGGPVIRLTNRSDRYLDLSDARLEPIEVTVRGGVVLPPGSSAVVHPIGDTTDCCIVAGTWDPALSSQERVDLIGTDGTVLATL